MLRTKLLWARFLRGALLVAAFLCGANHAILGQTQASSASFSGTIADPAGARIPNAKVTLSSPDKGISRVFTTDGPATSLSASCRRATMI